MTVSELLTDTVTRAELGPGLLTELGAVLRAVDCQTCGRRFGRREKPALVVQAVAGAADASLHHSGCRAPRWYEYEDVEAREFTAFPHVTWRVKLMLLPTGSTLVFLVNPYYELATLRVADGQWRLATLDTFVRYGMGTDPLDGTLVQPALSVVVDEDRISVQITDKGAVAHRWHLSPLPRNIREVVDTKEWLTVGVTTSLDLGKRIRGNPLPELVSARQVLLGAASTTYTERAQLLSNEDFTRKVRLEMIGLTIEMIHRKLGIEVGDEVISAVLGCCAGDSTWIMRLGGRDKLVSALLVAVLYAATSRTASGSPAPGGGVHVIAADAAAVTEFSEMAAGIAEFSHCSVAELTAEPTNEQRSKEYLADIVVGTPEQFGAAYAFYRDDDGDWSLHETRGRLAVVIGLDAKRRLAQLIHRYPRVTVV
jgi:hypothetical protein